MKRSHSIEVLPELLSEFVFVALLVVGVMLFFLWVTRARPKPVAVRTAAGSLPDPLAREAVARAAAVELSA